MARDGWSKFEIVGLRDEPGAANHQTTIDGDRRGNRMDRAELNGHDMGHVGEVEIESFGSGFAVRTTIYCDEVVVNGQVVTETVPEAGDRRRL